jgi:CheY-like chemotaxis protein
MHHQPTVLVVDDDPELREIYAAFLSEEGFRVETAENGAEGISVARRTLPDLILLDIEMPVMDGVGFATAYSRLPGRHAPIVVCSSAPRRSDIALIQPASVVTKPCDLELLLEVVNREVTVS